MGGLGQWLGSHPIAVTAQLCRKLMFAGVRG